ncbi:NAD-dependent epimerase/dehydratase family protein [Lysobacter arvi]|uniref:GDP-mannose 4,6-dehydratase n=1 Tax=Lysobacter arvi TaxID=3038776 RepID=A0ABU1CFA2_9GAMM|nr:GDP-mannose 4,6-dehydratase [Lysobacter arvi]MDR0183635.1 GDP-mannose 4,6-dehydratase [Lysobacter arvi]
MATRSDNGLTALVTGASGFTGRYVVKDLAARGYRVVRWGHGRDGDDSMASVDLTDRDAVLRSMRAARPDVVVHLAAISFVAHGDAEEIYRVNVIGSRNLLEACAQLDDRRRRVLLASSANVYGDAEGAVSEAVQPSPKNDYAVSKLAMEYMARLWRDRLSITVVRPFNYTGVGQSEKFLLPKIVAHFQRRATSIELGNLDVSRDFYDVRNVAQAYGRLLEVDAAEEVFNVCSGSEVALSEVIALMEHISEHRMEVRVNPAFVRASEVKHLRGDNARLREAIGILPHFSLEETLRWMFESGSGVLSS